MPKKKIIYFVAAAVLFLTARGKDELGPFSERISPNDFLSSGHYEKLIVEVRYVPGYEPTQQTQNNLLAFLNARLYKPGGISIVKAGIPAQGKSSYSIDDVKEIEYDYRTQFSGGETATAFFFFADAGYSGDGSSAKALGIAYRPTSVVIFEKTIHDYSGGLTQPTQEVLESTVVHHEFGHLLGLVNYGTLLQSSHQDVANGHHCSNSNCLMYYQAETSDIVANLIGGIPELDNACINDLRGNGGK